MRHLLSTYLLIRLAQYLEALSWQGARDSPPELAPWRPLRVRGSGDGGTREKEGEEGEEEVDMDQVVVVLKALEPLCSQQVSTKGWERLQHSNAATHMTREEKGGEDESGVFN